MNKTTKLIVLILLVIGGVWFFTRTAPEVTAPVNEQATEQDAASEPIELKDDENLTLDAEASTMSWSAERIVGSSHTGTVALKSGFLTREGGEFTGGEFIIDMTAISEAGDNARFLGHISSDDFFSVETYPESRLVLTSIVPTSSDGNVTNYDVEGDLTIKDQTHDVAFVAKGIQEAPGLRVTSSLSIDRTRWGVTYDSGTVFQQIGDKAIRDEVPFTLDLVFSVGE